MAKFVNEITPITRIKQVYVGMCGQKCSRSIHHENQSNFLTKPFYCKRYRSITTVTRNICTVVMLWCIECDITIVVLRPLLTSITLSKLQQYYKQYVIYAMLMELRYVCFSKLFLILFVF